MAKEKTYITDRVYEDLFNMLVGGDYAPGDKIPSENELKAHFNVSRNTIRAALNRMNMLGIIETRQGDGTYMKGLGANAYLSSLAPSILANKDDLLGLLSLRRGIEVQSARLAAMNVTDEELQDMVAYFDTLHSKAIDNHEFALMTSSFHQKIALASKNKLLADMLQIISWITTAKMADFLVYKPNVADSSYYHYMIFRCIQQRRPEEAAFMMDCHMKLLIHTVEDFLSNATPYPDVKQGIDQKTIHVTNIFEKREAFHHDKHPLHDEGHGIDGL